MKRLILATLGFGGIAASFAIVGLLATMNADYILGRYSGSMRVVSNHLNLLSVSNGYISQEAIYQTDEGLMTVWRWYARRFKVEPEKGVGEEGHCVTLANTTQLIFVRRTVVARLCLVSHGTLVFVAQTMHFAYPMSASNFSRSP